MWIVFTHGVCLCFWWFVFYVCIYVCTCVRTCKHTHGHAHVHGMHVCPHVCMHCSVLQCVAVCCSALLLRYEVDACLINTCPCACMYGCTCACFFVCMYTRVHVYIYLYILTLTHTYICMDHGNARRDHSRHVYRYTYPTTMHISFQIMKIVENVCIRPWNCCSHI